MIKILKKTTQKLVLSSFLNLLVFSQVFADFDSRLFGGRYDSYEAWFRVVWNWAMVIMIPISVVVLSVAGILYMTSEGDSNRVALAKRLVVGVLSGVGLLVLARLIMTVVGVGDFYVP